MSGSNFDEYVVFVPGECAGMTWGHHQIRVLALDKPDAIVKACGKWYGTGAKEGVYMVALAADVTAYEVDEARVPRVLAQVNLPDQGADSD